jgi:hypothetical protein
LFERFTQATSIFSRLSTVIVGKWADLGWFLRAAQEYKADANFASALRTIDQVTEQYFCDHPEEIDDYLAEIFQAYAEDHDSGALLSSLRVLARV